jgi:hypothetical protein
MSVSRPLYDFVYRGQLAEQALDAAGRLHPHAMTASESDLTNALSFELFDPDMLASAQTMSIVYAAIAAFEHSARKFVTRVLVDEYGEEWQTRISEKIRKFAEERRDEEEKTKWHGVRGSDLLGYTELKHLPQIIGQNYELFEPYVRSHDWVNSIFVTLERSRNVIMHSGVLDPPDVERIGMAMRDWNKQVGL